jgi:hypothetical protein
MILLPFSAGYVPSIPYDTFCQISVKQYRFLTGHTRKERAGNTMQAGDVLTHGPMNQ